VRDVDRKSILEIAAEITELTDRARSGRSKIEDLQGGTFTVTSTGNIGGLFATPIINHPEVAILGVPKIRQRPLVRDGQVVIRDVLWVAMSLDHRVVDGAVGARFTNMLVEYLTDPTKIFLELS
jgi:pyruvate dehydrogenase E2 component (dihydrolipoamide acetyltransferase)